IGAELERLTVECQGFLASAELFQQVSLVGISWRHVLALTDCLIVAIQSFGSIALSCIDLAEAVVGYGLLPWRTARFFCDITIGHEGFVQVSLSVEEMALFESAIGLGKRGDC